MGIIVFYVYISYDLFAIFFYSFFYLHIFFLFFIIMYAKTALIVGLMICALINTEAKRKTDSIKDKEMHLLRMVKFCLSHLPYRMAWLKRRYSEYKGSWEELEAEMKDGINSLKDKKPIPTSMRQLLKLLHPLMDRIDRKLKGTSLTEYRHKMRSGDLPAYLFLNGSIMLLMLFCSISALMSFRWLSIMFFVLFCFISVEISEIQLVLDGR